MNTVLRVGGLRVQIYVDDHEPAHVHVFGDGMTRIAIVGPSGQPYVVSSRGANFREV